MNTRTRISITVTHLKALFERGIHFMYELCIRPRSEAEDTKRHEFILNTILCGIVPFLIVLDGFIAYAVYKEGHLYRGIPLLLFTFIVMIFLYLLVLSRNGYYKLAAIILIVLYFLTTTYGALRWGVELPLVAISYVVIIVIASILISTRFGFFVTAVIALTIVTVCLLQIHHIVIPLLYWKYMPVRINDAIQLSIVFFLITIVSWLSNREMERSLVRARNSEHALMEERNLLEIKVEERTKELKEAQKEKVAQLYHFAEFGRISAGVFHDMMNSLQAVVSSVSRLESNGEQLPEMKQYLQKAVEKSKEMGSYIGTVRRQIKAENAVSTTFLVEKEIKDAIDMLRFQAREANVTVRYIAKTSITLHGNPLTFYQIILNLLINAIDACGEKQLQMQQVIHITLSKNNQTREIVITIRDTGNGISDENMERIFDSFFTTKQHSKGLGFGLSHTKEIIEKEFNGGISVTSTIGKGSTFIVRLPMTNRTIPYYDKHRQHSAYDSPEYL